MKRLLPSPLLSLVLLLTWLLLNQSVEPAQLLLGALLAVVAPLLSRPLQPHGYARIRRPLALLRLLSQASVEVLRSCFNVTRIILFARSEGLNSQFVRIPLDMKSPHGLAMLAAIINLTPGTVWVEILPESNELALHVFDLHDAQWWVDTVKRQYEQPLIEIFGG
ncbi:Na+/H+ antiporter subunit E [Azonexus sp. R2A61]|uniref:Na+/H+ antiporter subunit E n=1 Tax=Azonexus sp. R2A61 TaxID=2744443 RepID=UPI001F48A694|nr:Na+/H+ antiporter subunit E [Azonexus sp. R2A61]